jgi:hypothetical protein
MPPPTLAEVSAAHWPAYAQAHCARLAALHYRAARAILSCRTAEKGMVRRVCAGCGAVHVAPPALDAARLVRCDAETVTIAWRERPKHPGERRGIAQQTRLTADEPRPPGVGPRSIQRSGTPQG